MLYNGRMNTQSDRPLIALTVAAIVRSEQGYLIVDEWVRGKRLLNQPAGHVEPGESPETAVIREVAEETGYAFTPQALLGLYHDNPEAPTANRVMRVAYIGSLGARLHQSLDSGIISADFYSRTALIEQAERHRSDFVMRAIDDFERGQQFPLHVIHSLV